MDTNAERVAPTPCLSLATINMTLGIPPRHRHDIFRRLPYELRIEVVKHLVASKAYGSAWSLAETTRSWWDVLAPILLTSLTATLDDSLSSSDGFLDHPEVNRHIKRLDWSAEAPWDMRNWSLMWHYLDKPLPRRLPSPFDLLFMDRRKLVKLQPYAPPDHVDREDCILPCLLCPQLKEHPEWLPYAYPPDFYHPDAFSVKFRNPAQMGFYVDDSNDWVMQNGPTPEGQISGLDSWADCEREIVATIDRLPNLEAFTWDMEIALPSTPIVDALVQSPKGIRMFHATSINPRSDAKEALPLLAGVEFLSLDYDDIDGSEELLTKAALQLFDALCSSQRIKHLRLKIDEVDDEGYRGLVSLSARLHSLSGAVYPRRVTKPDKRRWKHMQEQGSEIHESLGALRPLLRRAWMDKEMPSILTADDVVQVYKRNSVLRPLAYLVDLETDTALAQRVADVWNAQDDKGPNDSGWPNELAFSVAHDSNDWDKFPPFAPEP